MVNILI